MKRTFKTIAISLFIVALYSCDKDKQNSCDKDKQNDINEIEGFSKTPPAIPATIDIELNGDSIYDFKTEYLWYTCDGINISGDGISGCITPLNDNLVLYHQNDGYLFLKTNDTVFSTAKQPIQWSSFPADLVSISTTINYYWGDEWRILGDSTQNVHFIGIKIKKDDKFSIGWLKLAIDKNSGEIKMLDKRLTDDDYIIIEK